MLLFLPNCVAYRFHFVKAKMKLWKHCQSVITHFTLLQCVQCCCGNVLIYILESILYRGSTRHIIIVKLWVVTRGTLLE